MNFKKCIPFMTALCLTAGSVLNVSAVNDTGDVDQNSEINSKDALVILNHIAENVICSEEQLIYADIDGNGIVDSNDALMILQYVVNVKDSIYEKYEGTSWKGLFGEERTESYVSGNFTFDAFSIDITSLNDRTISGKIFLSGEEAYFTVDIVNGTANIKKKNGLAIIDMDLYFMGSELQGKVNKAEILGEVYSFPTLYFVKK